MPPQGDPQAHRPEEQEWLAQYDPHAYTPVAVTVDVIVLTLRQNRLHVLLVQRAAPPFQDCWALPGGFVRAGEEDLDQAAARELAEETGLDTAALRRVHLEQLGSYGTPGRDPRMHVVSIAYLAFAPDLPVPQAGSDAATASWTPVAALGPVRPIFPGDHRLARPLATLSNRPSTAQYVGDPPPGDAPHQTAFADPGRSTGQGPGPAAGPHRGGPGGRPPAADPAEHSLRLAFDHARILADALDRARAKLEYTPLATAFLGTEFTIAELRAVYEEIWGEPLHAGNFHRKILSVPGFVESTGRTAPHAGSRGGPRPRLYRAGDAQLLHPALLRPDREEAVR